MCVGIPMRVVSVDGYTAIAEAEGRRETLDLALVGPVPPGTMVLAFLGAARAVLDETEAEQITRALAGLAAAMAGEDLGDAFADLEAEGPCLPPHLEAARRAGLSQA